MKRTERVATSVTPDTKQELRVLAAERGMSMSEFVREILLEELKNAEGSEGNRNPTPTMQPAD